MNHLHTTAVCEHGIDCASDKPGHSMTFMRKQLSHVDKVAWFDAVVVGFEGEWAIIENWESGERVSIWNHEDLRVELDVNDLVRVNTTYNTLAIDERRISVAIIKGENDA